MAILMQLPNQPYLDHWLFFLLVIGGISSVLMAAFLVCEWVLGPYFDRRDAAVRVVMRQALEEIEAERRQQLQKVFPGYFGEKR